MIDGFFKRLVSVKISCERGQLGAYFGEEGIKGISILHVESKKDALKFI